MTFTQNHIQTLLQLVQNTRDVKINCDECIAQAAEFAETQLPEFRSTKSSRQ